MNFMNEERLKKIIFKFFASVTILLNLGFLIVLPLDVIVQAAKSSVFDTFIAVGGIVLVIIFILIYTTGRILIHRKHLRFVPKSYLPLLQKDIPNKRMWKLIWMDSNLTKNLSSFFMKPDKAIVHDGMSPPEYVYQKHAMRVKDRKGGNNIFDDMNSLYSSTTQSENSLQSLSDGTSVFEDIEPSTNYEMVLKVLFDKLKYEGNVSNALNLKNEDILGITFEEYMAKIQIRLRQFKAENEQMLVHANIRAANAFSKSRRTSISSSIDEIDFDFTNYIRLYRKLRFSGKPIQKNDFKNFLDDTLLLFKIYSTYFSGDDQGSSVTSLDNENVDSTSFETESTSLASQPAHSYNSPDQYDRYLAHGSGDHFDVFSGEQEVNTYYPSPQQDMGHTGIGHDTSSERSFGSVRRRF